MLNKGCLNMPRTGRIKSESGIYYITGINRQTIFEEDEDAIKFLETSSL